ncbi:MAG TPA: VWA domain-containing protein, partial [Polyangia bacterium]|nr:VWA domain-containing protein [Polyangia bacterium]
MVVIDSSPSMLDDEKIQAAGAASSKFIGDLDLTRDQGGVILFSGGANLTSPLTTDVATLTANMNAGIQSYINDCAGFCAGGTNIPVALDAAANELTGLRHHAGSQPVIVFISDGGNTGADPTPQLARLRAAGIKTISLAIGAYIDIPMMREIASTPNDYFYALSANEVDWVYSNITQDLCRNRVPLVSAGGDQGVYSVTLPHVLTLNGEVHDDGAANEPQLTSTWTVVSGPGPVSFADASAPVTTAVFDTPGTYVLQLAATDGFLETADRATISVDSEPSLAGATLVAALGTSGPLTLGTSESLVATLMSSTGQPIADFPVQVTVTGPNAQTATVTTNAAGVATLSYTGTTVGTDVLTAVALGIVQVSAAPVSMAWIASESEQVVTQGWIGGPTHQSTVSGQVGVTVSAGITLTTGTVTYWPMSAPDQVHTLAMGVSGGPGAVVATLDTTTLANGPWI